MKPAHTTPLRLKVYVIFALMLLGGLGLHKLVTSDGLAILESKAAPLVDSIKRLLPQQSTETAYQVVPMGDAAYEELKGKLPELQGWRTFAKPLGLSDGSLLLFQRSGQIAVVWHIDWKGRKVSSFPIPEIKLDTPSRYTALASREGIWLLGDTTVLIQPSNRGLSLKSLWGDAENVILNERRVYLKTQFNEPVATLLKDQSVLVLGPSLHGQVLKPPVPGAESSDEGPRMQQLRLDSITQQLVVQDRGVLSYTGESNKSGQTYRTPRYGHGAVTLDSGQVLLFGGDVTPNLASLIEPGEAAGDWIPKPIAALPNPRVFGAAIALPGDRVLITGAPHLGCYGESAKMRSVDLYEVRAQQWSSLPLLPMVPCADAYGADVTSVTLTPNGSIVVAGHLDPQAMVLRPDTQSPTGYEKNWRVVGPMPLRRISGVVHALSDQEIVVAGGVDRQLGQCCYATSGFDVIPLVPKPPSKIVQSMMWIEPGVARRGPLLFVGGGRRFGSTGFGLVRYSAAAELLDLSTGQIESLPNIPFATGAAQAEWLDDNRILFQGRTESNNWGLSSYMPHSSNETAIYQVREKRWSPPLPSDKRLIFTGGAIQHGTVSVTTGECESTPEENCPEQNDGSAQPAAQSIAGAASDPVSAIWAGNELSRVTTTEGCGMVLFDNSNTQKQSLLWTNSGGSAWAEIPLPEFGEKDNGHCGACTLLSSADPRAPGQDLIFFRKGAIYMDHMEDELEEQTVRVWVWDENEQWWHPVLQSKGMAARSHILPLEEPLSQKEGARMMSLGWHLRNPVLWLAP